MKTGGLISMKTETDIKLRLEYMEEIQQKEGAAYTDGWIKALRWVLED